LTPPNANAPLFDLPKPDASLAYQTPAPGAIVVRTQEEYTRVAEHLKTIKAFQRRVSEWFAPLKKKASDAHRALCDEENKALRPAAVDEKRIKDALVAYTSEQERIRHEERIRLEREAREREETARLEQAAAQQPIALLCANQSALDGQARSLKQSMAIPGVELLVEKTPIARMR
jgi:hypothetical protein